MSKKYDSRDPYTLATIRITRAKKDFFRDLFHLILVVLGLCVMGGVVWAIGRYLDG